MKLSSQYKVLSTITLLLAYMIGFAQVSGTSTVELDPLIKIIGGVFALAGVFMGYMTMKMGNRMAELEAKIYKSLAETKENFLKKIEDETEKLEIKITLTSKELELKMEKMATTHDINNLKTVINLQHENMKLSNDALKEQLLTAANIYKRDKQ